ncbi:FAD-dependent oxidoreductase [Chloroflexota bacterium]
MLPVDFCGCRLKNPLLIGAGPYSCDASVILNNLDRISEAGWAGVVLKSIACEEKLTREQFMARPHIFPVMGSNGLIGIQNYGPTFTNIYDIDLKKTIDAGNERGLVIIPSIIAEKTESWVYLAGKVEDSGAQILELDLSCPVAPEKVSKGDIAIIDSHPELVEEVVSAVTDRCSLPVIAKFGPNLLDPTRVIKAAKAGGASGVTAVNTLLGLNGIDIETGIPLNASGNNKAIFAGLSGDLLRPVGLRFVAQIASAVDIPIMGVGGISTARDVIEYLMVGATVVQIVTAIYLQGYSIATKILEELTAYMERKGYKSTNEFRGVSLKYIVDDHYQLSREPLVATIEENEYPPCQFACPLKVASREYINLISDGDFRKAIDVHRSTTPFLGSLGRVCSHPCEIECERRKVEQPISIRALKRFLADYEFRHGRNHVETLKATKKKKVAIVGAGPAGLSCAYDIAKQGYPVTVFEADPKPGGLLRYGIPEYRLPKDILDFELDLFTRLGIDIQLNSEVSNVPDLLKKGYNAVFVAIGAGLSQKTGLEDNSCTGIISALDFLKRVNSGESLVNGDRVAVIGGGNAAVDASRMALRLGAKKVDLIYRRTRSDMPAIKSEVDQAEKEGVNLKFLVSPVRVVTRNKAVIGIECCEMEFGEYDDSGRRQTVPMTGAEQIIDIDYLVLAVGQRIDQSVLGGTIEVDSDGFIAANRVTLETNVRGIFAGGDVAQIRDAVWAMASGKEAAVSISRFLEGNDIRNERQAAKTKVKQVITNGAMIRDRVEAPIRGYKGAGDFREIELGYGEDGAIEEAKRCLQCGICSRCWTCVIACGDASAKALSRGDDHVVVDGDVCIGCGVCATVCPAGAVELTPKNR